VPKISSAPDHCDSASPKLRGGRGKNEDRWNNQKT
jgi:hypothetical protein